MQIFVERPSAQILPFTTRSARSRPLWTKRFTAIDRIQALEWNYAHAHPAGARVKIHDWQDENDPDIGDYIGIYRAHEQWMAWGAARDGACIIVWHGADGTDLGKFSSMTEALAAVSAESIQSRAYR